MEKVKEKKNENTKKSNDPQQDKHIPVPLKEKTIFPPLVQLFNQSTNRIACLTAFEGGGKTQVFFSYPPFSSRDTSCFVVHLRFSRLHFRSMPPHFFFSFLIFSLVFRCLVPVAVFVAVVVVGFFFYFSLLHPRNPLSICCPTAGLVTRMW